MTDYLKTVIAVCLFVSLVCGILPKEGAGKYTAFASGLIITAVLVSPLFNIFKTARFSLSEIQTEELNAKSVNYIMEEFEKTLALKIQENLGDNTEVVVYAKTDKNGKITGVEKVEISPFSAKNAQKISRLLDIEENMVVEK